MSVYDWTWLNNTYCQWFLNPRLDENSRPLAYNCRFPMYPNESNFRYLLLFLGRRATFPQVLLNPGGSSLFHSGYFYSASSSPLQLRGAPDTVRILCRSFTPKRHRQLWVKDLPKVPTRLERDSNLQPFGRKAPNLPMSRHVPRHSYTYIMWKYLQFCIKCFSGWQTVFLFWLYLECGSSAQILLGLLQDPPTTIKLQPVVNQTRRGWFCHGSFKFLN